MNKIVAIALLLANLYFGQQTHSPEIEKPIRNLFLGMKNIDPELLSSAFSDTAILQTITQTGVKNEDIKDL